MLVAMILACSPTVPVEPPKPAAPDTDPFADTAPPVDTSAPDTAPPSTPPSYDCGALPAAGTLVGDLDYMPTFEDFTFSADGYAWGVSLYAGELTRVPYGGPAEILRPGVSTYARGTRFLRDGDLVSVDYTKNALVRIDVVTTAVTLLTSALTTPNGVAIGEDGFVYLSQLSGELLRIDPVTGVSELLATSPVSNDGISFSPDYRTLYLASDHTDDFMSVGVDGSGAVTTPLTTITQLPGVSDGMVVDACGNAYVTQFSPPGLVRVRPDGTVEPFIEMAAGALPVSANFGTGVGGWEADHLFISDWNGGMTEYTAGVPGKWEPHLPAPGDPLR